MASLPDSPLVTVDEYLNTSYRPDVEFVDGVLVERSMPTPVHGVFQALLAEYFRMYRGQLRFAVYLETRTQIVERSRYRIPDVMLASLPIERGRVITKVPWVVVEIQSPEDRMPEQLRRFRDYVDLGVSFMILLDPEQLMAWRYQRGSLVETEFKELELPTGRMPFDSVALFRKLQDELNEQ